MEQVAVLGDHAEGLADARKDRSRTSTPPSRTAPASTSYRRGTQLRDRRLPGAGRADQGDRLARLGAERDVVQDLDAAAGVEGGDLFEGGQGHLVGRRVGEADAVELDGDGPVRHRARLGPLRDERLEVEDLEDALEADQGAHHLDAGAGERGQRRVEAGEEQREGDDRARVEAGRAAPEAAEAVHEREGQRGDQGERGDEHVLHHRGADADVADAAGAERRTRRTPRRAAEQLHQRRARRGEPLGHLGAHRGVVRGGLPLRDAPGGCPCGAPGRRTRAAAPGRAG